MGEFGEVMVSRIVYMQTLTFGHQVRINQYISTKLSPRIHNHLPKSSQIKRIERNEIGRVLWQNGDEHPD